MIMSLVSKAFEKPGEQQKGRQAQNRNDNLAFKLNEVNNYLKKLNDNINESDKQEHMPKRITNVEILKIEVIHLDEQGKTPGETPLPLPKKKSKFTDDPATEEEKIKKEARTLFNNANIDVDFNRQIVFQSQITLRIFYVYENESIDLTTKPETFQWKIKIKEN